MQLNNPEWFLRRNCPCDCGGEGKLLFITCPKCSHISLACTETGSIFPNIKILTTDSLKEEGDLCVSCRSKAFAEFNNATADQIALAGVQQNEYK